jgi:uncharacterized protein YbjT (DUF2867 family)
MIVITAATGRIGSKTAALLLAEGKKVKLISRDPNKLEKMRDQGACTAKGDMMDSAFLTEAFTGADAVFLLLPPSLTADNIAAFQQAAGEAQVEAVVNAGVKSIVFISSLGIEASGNGSIVNGLALQEKRLNALPADVNVISLRPTGFMENLLTQIGLIRQFNAIYSPLRADLKTGIIATQDIATVAARKLSDLDFRGKNILNLLGSRDYAQREMASIVGNAIGQADLAYVQVSYEDNRKAMIQHGISESVADGLINMLKNIDAGLSMVERLPENTTPTTLEYFAQHDFKAAFSN